jgi:hypothetical protein
MRQEILLHAHSDTKSRQEPLTFFPPILIPKSQASQQDYKSSPTAIFFPYLVQHTKTGAFSAPPSSLPPASNMWS